MDLTTGMTLEAWVNPTTANGWRTVVMKERPAGLAYALYLTDSNRPSTVAFTSNEYDIRPFTQLATNAWTHVATTYDGATLRLCVNGSQVSSRSLTGALAVSSGALRIGGNAIWDEFFAGRLDDVRVYGRALSGGEIQVDMNTPVADSDTQAPSAPGDLTASVSNVKQVDLSWTAATDARDAAGNATTSAPCPFTVSNPPSQLIAAYGFEEPSGDTVTDASGRGHTGTISGAARTAAGKFGRALTFDGVDDLVDVAHTSAFNVSSRSRSRRGCARRPWAAGGPRS